MKDTGKILEQLKARLGYEVTPGLLRQSGLEIDDFVLRPELFYFVDAAMRYDTSPPGERRIKSVLSWVAKFKNEKYRVFLYYLKFFPNSKIAWEFYSYFKITTSQGVKSLARWAQFFNLPSVADTAMQIFPNINAVPDDENLVMLLFTAYELIKIYRIPYNKRRYRTLLEIAQAFRGKENYMQQWFSFFRNLSLIRAWLKYFKPEDFAQVKKIGKIPPEDLV